jgi:hypothetical protein
MKRARAPPIAANIDQRRHAASIRAVTCLSDFFRFTVYRVCSRLECPRERGDDLPSNYVLFVDPHHAVRESNNGFSLSARSW